MYASNYFHYIVEERHADEMMLHLCVWAFARSWPTLSKLFIKSLPFVRGNNMQICCDCQERLKVFSIVKHSCKKLPRPHTHTHTHKSDGNVCILFINDTMYSAVER